MTARLAECFSIGEDEDSEAVAGAHALHPWPGRMHPLWARRILSDLPEDASVLDPFCGGGTVLVEARMLGLHARGSDINPIAVRLARLKCIPHADPARVKAEATRCFEDCTTRRDTPFSRLAQAEKSFPKHVLAALISLRDEIEKAPDARTREILLFCMSPLLDKLAARPNRDAPRVPRNAVRDLFMGRVDQWLAVWAGLEGVRWAEVEHADARWLPWKPGTASAVITSPPYPGVYDYAGMQQKRAKWLGDPRALLDAKKNEIGRRNTPATWTQDMGFALKQMCRTVRPGSPIFLVVGDGIMQGEVIRADKALRHCAKGQPLELSAMVSMERPHFHRGTIKAFAKKPRREHLMLFTRL